MIYYWIEERIEFESETGRKKAEEFTEAEGEMVKPHVFRLDMDGLKKRLLEFATYMGSDAYNSASWHIQKENFEFWLHEYNEGSNAEGSYPMSADAQVYRFERVRILIVKE